VGILSLLNRDPAEEGLVREILGLVKSYGPYGAVGILLRDGDDVPYLEANGIPDSFLRMENSLCARDAAGMLVRDAQGNPVLECMRGTILRGRTDPTQPCFSEGGRFWTTSTTDLLATTAEKDRRGGVAMRRKDLLGDYESCTGIPLRQPVRADHHRETEKSLPRSWGTPTRRCKGSPPGIRPMKP
jgi:hypothetical protein